MRKRICTVIGTAMMAAAALLAACNVWDDWRAGRVAEAVIEQLDAAMEQREQPEEAAPVVAAEAEPTFAEQPTEPQQPNGEMVSVALDAGDCVGTVTIPKLKRSLPVMSEWSYPLLKKAPCRYSGSIYDGDMVIAGHNYRSHFGGGFGGLKAGDRIYFTDVDGNRFDYRISRTETLKPTAIEEMETGDWDLTLFTCTLGGKARFAVRCKLA